MNGIDIREVLPFGPPDEVTRLVGRIRFTESGCWLTQQHSTYASITINRRTRSAHRVTYEWAFGTLPSLLDHIACSNRRCCNPFHLKPATFAENLLRGTCPAAVNARKTHCLRGHSLERAKLYLSRRNKWNRQCQECQRLRRSKRTERDREKKRISTNDQEAA